MVVPVNGSPCVSLSELGKMPNLYAILSKWGSVPRELSLAEVFQLGYYWETKFS